MCKDERSAVSVGAVTPRRLSRLKSSARRCHYFNLLATSDIHSSPVTVTVSHSLHQPTATSTAVDAAAADSEVMSSNVIIHRHGVSSSWQRKSFDMELSDEPDNETQQKVAVQSQSLQSVIFTALCLSVCLSV